MSKKVLKTNIFKLRKFTIIFYGFILVTAILVIWWVYLYYKIQSNFSQLQASTSSLKNLSSYNNTKNNWYGLETISDLLKEQINNSKEKVELTEKFEKLQVSYNYFLKQLYLPSLNIWKNDFTDELDLSIYWEKYLEKNSYIDTNLLSDWSWFFKYVWDDSNLNNIEDMKIEKIKEDWEYFHIPVSVKFSASTRKSFLVLINKLSITSNKRNIALINEYVYHLWNTIKVFKKDDFISYRKTNFENIINELKNDIQFIDFKNLWQEKNLLLSLRKIEYESFKAFFENIKTLEWVWELLENNLDIVSENDFEKYDSVLNEYELIINKYDNIKDEDTTQLDSELVNFESSDDLKEFNQFSIYQNIKNIDESIISIIWYWEVYDKYYDTKYKYYIDILESLEKAIRNDFLNSPVFNSEYKSALEEYVKSVKTYSNDDQLLGYNLYNWVKNWWETTFIDESIINYAIWKSWNCENFSKEIDDTWYNVLSDNASRIDRLCYYSYRIKYSWVPTLAYTIWDSSNKDKKTLLKEFFSNLPPLITIESFTFKKNEWITERDDQSKYVWEVKINVYWRYISAWEVWQISDKLGKNCAFESDLTPKYALEIVKQEMQNISKEQEQLNSTRFLDLVEIQENLEWVVENYNSMNNYEKIVKLFEIYRILSYNNISCN